MSHSNACLSLSLGQGTLGTVHRMVSKLRPIQGEPPNWGGGLEQFLEGTRVTLCDSLFQSRVTFVALDSPYHTLMSTPIQSSSTSLHQLGFVFRENMQQKSSYGEHTWTHDIARADARVSRRTDTLFA